MVNITIDESCAFDYLSISELDSLEHPYNEQVRMRYLRTVKSIIRELGTSLFRRIVHSREYGDCAKANLRARGLVKPSEGEARTSDASNAIRDSYAARDKLQRRFFGNGLSKFKFD